MHLRSALAALVLTAFASPALAHPHVWVDARSEIVYEDGRIVAVRHIWRFDEMFSAFAIQGLDEDGDGILTREELEPLAEVNVTSLHEYGFFTFLESEGEDAAFGPPEDYWLEHEDELLTLFFTLPLAEPTEPADPGAEIVLDVFDPEYFVAFTLVEDDPVRLTGAPQGCAVVDVSRPDELDPYDAMLLAEVPPDTRELPSELTDLTQGLENRVKIACS